MSGSNLGYCKFEICPKLVPPCSRCGWDFLEIFALVYQSSFLSLSLVGRGWSGGAMVLGKLPVPGRPTFWITVGQGPTALAVGAGGGCLDGFTLSSIPTLLIPPLFARRPDITLPSIPFLQ